MNRKTYCMAMAFVLSVIGIGGALRGQGAPADVPAVALDDIVKDLGNADFQVRERAQKRLEELPAGRRAELAKRAETATDPEVKARLQARVEAIDIGPFLPFLHPPRITMEVKQASLADMRAALAKAAGFPVLDAFPIGAAQGHLTGAPVTLKVKDAQWGEVIKQLSEQVPLTYEHTATCVRIGEAAIGVPGIAAQGKMTAAGPIVMVAGSALRAAQARDRVTLSYTMFVDPRMQVLEQTYELTNAVDDLGRKLELPTLQRRLSHELNRQGWGFVVTVPDGAKTLTLKGEAHLKVAVKYAITKIEDLPKQVGKEYPLGAERSVVLQRFSTEDQSQPVIVSLSYRGQRSMEPLEGSEGRVSFAPVRAELRDADGKMLVMVGAPVGPSMGMSSVAVAGAKMPLHLDLMVPVLWKELVVPFELQGISVAGFRQSLGAR